MKRLQKYLKHNAVHNEDIDGEGRISAHDRVLKKKPLLRRTFAEFHTAFRRLDEMLLVGEGHRIEIGAGVAPLKNTYPDVIATDIFPSPSLDIVMDAQKMSLQQNSVRTIYGQNCFHHFPEPELFFLELQRVLINGGGAILLEPYHGPLATFLYSRMFETETFDKEATDWHSISCGPMKGANQALSYIVFERDRADFCRRFPGLQLVHQELCCNYIPYLFSGGLNFRQLVPTCSGPVLTAFQRLLSPFDRWLALHHLIVIKKT